jgi:ribonucleotide reductase alpha subunit
VAIIAIKGKVSSSKSFFPKLSKHICLMAKEGRKMVKSNISSSPQYVTSDKDTLSSDDYDSSDDDNSFPSKLVKNPNAMIKGLMKQVGARDELLEQQEELLVQDRKISEELKKLLALEKAKVEKLDQELAKSNETTCSFKISIGALQGQHDVLLKTHQDLEVQFDALWSSTLKTSTNNYRVKTKGQEFIKFTKANAQQEKK